MLAATAFSAITTARRAVFELLDGQVPVAVYPFLPGSADELPCVVVGRSEGGEGDARVVVEQTIPVIVLGRTATTRDDDAQGELDALTDAVLTLLWKPGSTAALRAVGWTPGTETVAAAEIPAYTVNVVAETTYC